MDLVVFVWRCFEGGERTEFHLDAGPFELELTHRDLIYTHPTHTTNLYPLFLTPLLPLLLLLPSTPFPTLLFPDELACVATVPSVPAWV